MARKKIPSKVQLPGGIVLNAIPFKIVEYHDDGSPKLFQIEPASATNPEFWLFADEALIRSNLKKGT